ncbi:hypothetical Protein psc1_00850 [Candidatus Phytoplasma solani]
MKRDFLNPNQTKSPQRAEALTKLISTHKQRKKIRITPPVARDPPFF